MNTKTQREAIADHLKAGHALTPLEALNLFGCLRLGARVWELKREGLNIGCTMVETPSGKRVAQYSIPFQLVA